VTARTADRFISLLSSAMPGRVFARARPSQTPGAGYNRADHDQGAAAQRKSARAAPYPATPKVLARHTRRVWEVLT
jgi:hypothetical protein